MRWFRSFRTAATLVSGFSIVCGLLVAVGWTGLSSMARLAGMTRVLYQRDMIGSVEVGEANVARRSVTRAARNVLLEPDPAGS